MSAAASPSVQTASPPVFPPSPSTFTATGPTSSFVKVYCGDDECVPLSKQCTGGTFQGVLSDLATRVSKGEAQAQGSRSHRVKAVRSAAAAHGAVSLSATVAGNNGRDGRGEATAAAEDRAGAAEPHREGVHGGGVDAKRKQFTPPPSSTALPTLKGVAPAASSAVPFHSTGTSSSRDAVTASAGDTLADGGGARMSRAVVYRRAELLPLSFVRDVASNSKVTALYKQHLQLQEQLRRHQLEQQEFQKQRDGASDAAAALAAMTAEGEPADAASSQETAGDPDGKGGKTQGSKPTPRRRGMPSVGRGGGGACGNRSASPVGSSATSAAAAAALAAQTRTQLWAALRNTIPFFGVLTMPVHTPVEPLISLPVAGPPTIAGATAARTATATTMTPPATGVVSAATAVCSGSYVLLGCRERPREAVLVAEAAPVFPPAGPYVSAALSISGGVASNPGMSAVERLVEQAHEASVARLPPLCSDAVVRAGGLASAPGAGGEGAKRSPQRSRSHPKEPHGQHISQQMLPVRCILQPSTNRVVPMAPPLPDDIAAGYGAARLVTQSLDQSAVDNGGDPDDSLTQSRARSNKGTASSLSRGHPCRGYRHSSQEIANSFASATDASTTAAPRRPLASGKGGSSTGLAKGGRGSGGIWALSDEVGVEGREDATPIEVQRVSYAAAASRGSCSPSTSPHKSSVADPSASALKDGEKLVKGSEQGIPLSAAAIALLTPSTRFTVQLSSCTVALTTQTRKGAVTNATDAPSTNAVGAANGTGGTGGVGGACGSAIGCGEVDNYADELAVVFDGLDVLWHGPNGEEALLQWVLDEYSILLKQRMAAAIAQWTSMVRAGDTSAGTPGGPSSKAGKARRQAAKDQLPA
ncbi:hypothetical protein GH5_08442 [Leishmania sp. Ghana 2012 LV757]|uniref:hypothetical protein n=1 Tax=Leishmania sp. Ghana 2012 LV757 TaxID=2803181 RepID=UPI001B7791B9|nr:hypothetical protein GH5_08442 [Leishmania sp. Ghana 2012 LV757]